MVAVDREKEAIQLKCKHTIYFRDTWKIEQMFYSKAGIITQRVELDRGISASSFNSG